MSAARLLNELSRLGVCLEVIDDKLRYSPKSIVPTTLVNEIRVYKGDLLAALKSCALEADKYRTEPAVASAPEARRLCPRCGAKQSRDVPIHGGRSVRRDCAKCQRFLEFPVWYSGDALRIEKHR